MALTWQSVSPSNPAGILQASNMAGANIAKGLDILGSSMQEGAKNKQDAETGKLLLMLDNAKSRNERQNILDNADKSYIDQDVIAKDNQEFEVREQQKEVQAFNRTMQEQGAARDIARDKATTAFQQWQREDSSKKAALQAENRAADVLARDAQNERMYQARVDAEKNKEAERKRLATLRALQEKRALGLDEQEHKKNEIQIKELEREQANVVKGEALVDNHQDKLTKASESVPDLVTYWTELDTAETGGVKAASDLKKQVATQLYKQIDRFDVFGEGGRISKQLRSVTRGTIQENKINHAYNVKIFKDRLRNILPGIIDENQLTSMSERMLNNVQMTEEVTYGDAALTLNKSIDRVRQDKTDEFSTMLFDRRESDDGISADEYAELDRYIKNLGNFNADTQAIRGNLSSMLKTEVDRQYNNTQLVNPNNAGYIDTLRKGAAIGGGLFDKNKIKTNHQELVTSLTNAEMGRANSFNIPRKEVEAKIKEQLSNIPGYETVLANADISWEQQKKNEESKNILKGSNLASSANSSEEISKAIKHHLDHNLPLPESLTKKQDTVIKGNISNIVKKSGLGTRGGVTTTKKGKEVFNYYEWNKWNTDLRDAIKKEHPYVPEATLEREIGNIVGKDKFLSDSLDMHIRTVDLLKKLAETTDTMKVERSKDEYEKAKDFENNPRLYLYEHIASSGAIGDILSNLKSKGNESTNIDNYNQTARNIQEVANRIYEVLREKHTGITPNELRIKAENAFNSLDIDTQWFYGNEASFDKMSKEEIIRAGENLVRDASDTGTTTNEAIRLLEAKLNAAKHPSVKGNLKRQLDTLKAQAAGRS